jgi:hypothetical protein
MKLVHVALAIGTFVGMTAIDELRQFTTLGGGM